MSDDEVMRQTPLPLDTPEPLLAKQFTFERKECVETSEKKSEVEDIDDSLRKKRVSFVPDDINGKRMSIEQNEEVSLTEGSVSINNNLSNSQIAKVVQKESITMQESEKPQGLQEFDVSTKRKSVSGKRMSIEVKEDISCSEGDICINNNLGGLQNSKVLRKESLIMQESEKPEESREVDINSKRKSISGMKMSIEQKEEMTFSDERVINDDVIHPKNSKLEEDNEHFGSALSRKASVERRESFSKVEVKNITESRRSSQSFIFNEVNKAELFDNVQSIPKAKDKDEKSHEALVETNNNTLSRKASVERRESFSMVEVKNIIESRKSSQSFIFDEVNKAELFDNIKSIPKATDKDDKSEEALVEKNNIALSRKASVTDELKKSRKASVESIIDDDDDNTGDSRTDELIKKIKKQRSILEEIIDKEDERSVEGI